MNIDPARPNPSPLRGRLGGGVPPPAWTLGFASLPLPRPLPAGEGRKVTVARGAAGMPP